MSNLPDHSIVDQDFRAYELRMMGLSPRQISKTLDISENSVRAGIKRASVKMQTAHSNAVEGITMDLDRLDRLMSNIWTLTMPHKVVTPDGDEISLPPNMDAVDRVLKIMAHRSKLQGWDQVTLNVNAGGGDNGQQIQIGPGEKPVAQITAKDEAQKLIEIMAEAGALPDEMKAIAIRALSVGQPEIFDAEIVEDEEEEIIVAPSIDEPYEEEPEYEIVPFEDDES